MKTNLIIDRIRKSIYDKDPHSEAYLFGSRARGDNRKNSDWDILILVNDPVITNDIDDKFRDQLCDIGIETGQIISILIYPKNTWESVLKFTPLYDEVKREGVRL
jgi:predicted nucleotidyltransferase